MQPCTVGYLTCGERSPVCVISVTFILNVMNLFIGITSETVVRQLQLICANFLHQIKSARNLNVLAVCCRALTLDSPPQQTFLSRTKRRGGDDLKSCICPNCHNITRHIYSEPLTICLSNCQKSNCGGRKKKFLEQI